MTGINRVTQYRDGAVFSYPIAAQTRIYKGHIVSINSDGYLIIATASAGTVVGIAQDFVNNTGANGELEVLVDRGRCFCLANDGLTNTDIGKPCFIKDSVTVARTGTVQAGILRYIDSSGAWVDI